MQPEWLRALHSTNASRHGARSMHRVGVAEMLMTISGDLIGVERLLSHGQQDQSNPSWKMRSAMLRYSNAPTSQRSPAMRDAPR